MANNYFTIDNIGDEYDQAITVDNELFTIDLRLQYLPAVRRWIISVTEGQHSRYGIPVTLGNDILSAHLFSMSLNVFDSSGFGIDPILGNDFSSGRCGMVIIYDDSK
jgi:hypothetical protein